MNNRSTILNRFDNKIENPLSDSQSTDAAIRGDSPPRLLGPIATPPKAGTRTTTPAVDPMAPPPPPAAPYFSTTASLSYSPPSSPPSAMPPKAKSCTKSPPIKIEKSRTIKRNYQRRKQGFKFTSQELRQIERNEELKKRADKIKDKERRAKVNKAKKEEKERKAREERARLGIPEPGVKVDPAQQRLSQLFGPKKAAVKGQGDCEDIEEEDSCSEKGGGREQLPPVDPVPAFGNVEEDGDSEMSDEGEETVTEFSKDVLRDPQPPSPAARGIDRGAGKSKTPWKPDLALPEDWSVYFDSNSQIERELAGDPVTNAASNLTKPPRASSALDSTANNPQAQSLNRKLLTPKAPSSKLNGSNPDVAAEVLAMISNQDLASDKENLDPAQPSPDEKTPDHNSPSKKRSHDEALSGDEDKENVAPKAKQLKRSPLEELSETSMAVKTEKDPLRERKVLEGCEPVPNTGVRPKTLQPRVTIPQPSSQDEYGLKDVNEADLIAEVEKAETPRPPVKFEPSFSQDEYDWNDIDGLGAEVIAKVKGAESAVNNPAVNQGTPSRAPPRSPAVKQSSSQEYGFGQSKSFDEALLAEANSFETPHDAQAPEAATSSQLEYGLSRSPSFESALIDELDRHETPARSPPRKAAPPKVSNEDEYSSADFDALNAEMVAETDGVETREGLKALGASLSNQGWFRDLMGTQELKDIGLG